MKRVVALILGGGQGKRLYPLTMYRSKPAVPIGGKYRLIDIPVSNCLHSGLKDIYVLTQFNSESLNNHINNTYRFDYFSRAFVRILAAEQTLDNANWFQGTADAVRRNLFHLDLTGDEEILILSGDHLYMMDYRELIHFHRQKGADFTVSVMPVEAHETKELGILRLNDKSKIASFKEKPKTLAEINGYRFRGNEVVPALELKHPSYLASMGVYLFNAGVLIKALEDNYADFGKELIPNSIKKFKAFGYVFNGYWRDIGTIKTFYDSNMEFTAPKPHFSFFDSYWNIFTRPRFLPSAKIVRCRVENSLITEGCLVEDADIRGSIVGLRSIIGRGCRIAKTVVMGADYYEDPKSSEAIRIGIGDGTIIERAIVDKNARIGKNCVIRNLKRLKNYDGENYFIRDGIVIVPKNAVLKDNTKI